MRAGRQRDYRRIARRFGFINHPAHLAAMLVCRHLSTRHTCAYRHHTSGLMLSSIRRRRHYGFLYLMMPYRRFRTDGVLRQHYCQDDIIFLTSTLCSMQAHAKSAMKQHLPEAPSLFASTRRSPISADFFSLPMSEQYRQRLLSGSRDNRHHATRTQRSPQTPYAK